MGSMTSALKAMTGANEDEQRQKERLQLVLLTAKAKVQTFRDELNESFSHPGQIDKKQVPGIRAVRFIEQYHAATRSSFNEQVQEHLDHAIDSFFAIGSTADRRESVRSGVKFLLLHLLAPFINSVSAGETEHRTYVLIPEDNALVRIDIACWKYHFEQTRLVGQHDSAVAYLLCKSVADHTQLTMDELVCPVTNLLDPAHPLRLEPESAPTDSFGITPTPALGAAMEAYTGELIRRWKELRTEGNKA